MTDKIPLNKLPPMEFKDHEAAKYGATVFSKVQKEAYERGKMDGMVEARNAIHFLWLSHPNAGTIGPTILLCIEAIDKILRTQKQKELEKLKKGEEK